MKMDKLLKQAQRMQAEMALAQEQLAGTVVEGGFEAAAWSRQK